MCVRRCMTAQQKERLDAEGEDLLKDRAFAAAVADQSGTYIEMEVGGWGQGRGGLKREASSSKDSSRGRGRWEAWQGIEWCRV